ncbi:MAG TPA: hypothetical protein ENK19_02415 [Acidobacteria bacterium]|nr:hypothetical protein [Acidobacteriota bacterium]
MADELERPQPDGEPEHDPASRPPEGEATVSSIWSRWLRLAMGWALVALGVVGLFVPILQGVLLISLGLVILSKESPALRRLGRRLGDRFPALRRLHDRIQRRRGGPQDENGEGSG